MSAMRAQMAKVDYPAILDAAWAQHLLPRRLDAPTVISLFAGCGGSSLGYSMAGYRELLAVEMNNRAVETFEANFPGVPVYHGDICELEAEECLRLANLKPGELDVLDGSPPCQGFSTAGSRKIDDPRNLLPKEYVRLLRGLMPRAFIMENVSGMVKGKMKLVFADIMRELKDSGYRVRCRLLNTMHYCVPQSRQRLIWIGTRNDLSAEPVYPETQQIISVGDALAGCTQLVPAPVERGQEIVLQHIPPGGGGAKEHVPEELLKEYIPRMYGKTAYSYGGMCRRLSLTRPAWTINKTYAPYGQTPIHPAEDRFVSIDEIRRLFSFPDGFVFTGTYTQIHSLLGNSVPPLFMRSIAEQVRTSI